MDNCNSPDSIPHVRDEEELFRRVTVKNQIVANQDGSIRLSSAIYRSTSSDISVDIASKTTPERSINDALALSSILARIPKGLGYPVVEDALPENPAHALIKGRITKSHARELAGKSSWAIEPDMSMYSL